MSFLSRITALIPFNKEKEIIEYFFALHITHEKITCALWVIENKQLKIYDSVSDAYSSLNDLIPTADKLLDESLGIREVEPQKILFGVPSSWLLDENLKEEYMKVLRDLVKELELTPMAYVENSHALVHFLEKIDGVPPTAILVGFELHHLTVTVTRAGKLDGVRIVSRGENSGADIEKALLSFTSVETLPSKILIYGTDIAGLKDQLLSYSWMSKLSFLHFPKIEVLQGDIEVKSICFAGASEIESDVILSREIAGQTHAFPRGNNLSQTTKNSIVEDNKETKKEKEVQRSEDLGFVVGDVSTQQEKEESLKSSEALIKEKESPEEESIEQEREEFAVPEETRMVEIEDFEHELPAPAESNVASTQSVLEKPRRSLFKKFLSGKLMNLTLILGFIGVLAIILGAYLFLPKAEVKIFVEPKTLEKDTQVIADPNQKTVNEDSKIIPGQVVETSVSGTAKDSATGQKQVGDPAKGTIIIYNKTFEGKTLSKGTVVSNSNSLKFVLDTTVSIASQSASDSGITFGKGNTTVTASAVGADGNLPSGSELTIANFSSSQLSAKAEGNFSGGTSKQVTVVSSDDQKKLLASLASDLRRQAQSSLQEKLPQKKILEEALSEEITKKTFSKNINDQANEFSLDLTARYKGTAFEDKDLKLIVGKLVTTQVPEGFQLNLEDTETQADVSKVEKDGKLIFLAKFKAKLMPKIDVEVVKEQIKGKSVDQAINTLKGMENVLGSEVKISPSLPSILQRLPLLGKNIKIEVGLK